MTQNRNRTTSSAAIERRKEYCGAEEVVASSEPLATAPLVRKLFRKLVPFLAAKRSHGAFRSNFRQRFRNDVRLFSSSRSPSFLSNWQTQELYKSPATLRRTTKLPEHRHKWEQEQHQAESGSQTSSQKNGDPEGFELGEDVYSLIFVSPIWSASFIFAAYMIILKLILFTFLAIDLYSRSEGAFDEKLPLIRATQFFLIPVAIAMQEDLIHVYTRIANIRYDESVMEISPSATETKFALSFLLRFADGLYSLIINFVLLLITDEVLSLFLNFAALGFLQSIDDVAFHLAAQGMFFVVVWWGVTVAVCQDALRCWLSDVPGLQLSHSLFPYTLF